MPDRVLPAGGAGEGITCDVGPVDNAIPQERMPV